MGRKKCLPSTHVCVEIFQFHPKVAELQAEANRLEKDHDDLSMDEEKDAITNHWDRVTDAAKKRKKDLEESYDLHVNIFGK